MGVLDGQPVSQAITNPAFINKNQDDVMANKLGFTRSFSGPSIADIQQAVNNLYTATGVSEVANGTTYNAPSGTISNGDSHLVALSKLAGKFSPTTGHMHTGAPGDGPLLNVVSSLAASGSSPIHGDLTLIAGTSMTITQSATGFTFSSVPSATTTLAASGYPDLAGQVILVAGSGVSLTQTGQDITIASSGSVSTTIAASGHTDLSGQVILVAGSGVTLSQSGQDITISASGGGGGSSSPPVSVIADTPTSTIPGTSTFYDITGWSTVDDNTGSFNPTTGIFTVPKTALYGYSIDLYLSFSSSSVNNSIFSHLLVNGTPVREGNTRLAVGLNAGQVAQSGTWELTAGDLVKFQVSADPTSASFVAGNLPCFFSIWEIEGGSSGSPVSALYNTATGTLTSSSSLVKFTGLVHDPLGDYNTSTGIYTVRVTGVYDIETAISMSGSGNAALECDIYINTVQTYRGFNASANAAFGQAYINITSVPLTAGDQVQIFANSQQTTPSFSSSATQDWFSIAMVGVGTSLSPNDFINIRYTNANGQSIPQNTETIVTSWTMDYDANGDFNPTTGIFTAPTTGKYRIVGNLLWSNSAWTAGNHAELRLQMNGTPDVRTLSSWYSPSNIVSTFFLMSAGVDSIQLTIGDTLAFALFQNDPNGHTVFNDSLYSWMTIEQIE